MKKFLTEIMYILMVLVGIAISLKVIAEQIANNVINNISGFVIILIIIVGALWAVAVVVLDFKERIKYEKKTLWPMICLYLFIVVYNIYREGVADGLQQALFFIVGFSVFNFLIARSRRDRVRIDSNYNLRDCKREDADFIYELKKEGFEWYIKDLEGWDEDKQREIIKNEMDAHLEDMNIIRYDFEDVGLFTYYEDENNDIFIDMLALMPKARNRGIGSNLLQFLIVNNPNKRIYLRTYKENPARQLYIRKGFSKYDETQTHWWMERKQVSE